MNFDPPAGRGHAGTGWRVFGGIIAVLAIGTGGVTAASWLARQTATEDQTYQRSTSHLVIQSGTGNLSLVPGAPGQIAVHRHLTWSYSKPKIVESWQGDTLSINVSCPGISFGPGCGVDYTIKLPADVPVTAHTSTGDISVRGLTSTLDLSTSTGNVKVDGAIGDLTTHTSTGDVHATGVASATVDARASTGNVDLRFVRPPQRVQARTSTGDVTLVVPNRDVYRVDAHTNTGDTKVSVATDPNADRSVTARASTGNITVRYG